MKTTFRVFALVGLLFVLPLQAQTDTFVMPGDLISKHAKLEQTCEKCHLKFDKAAQSGLCADCHKDVGRDVAGKRGFHGRLEAGKQCNECHPDHKGRWALAVIFDKEKFDHAQTDYPLKDGHADPKVTCESCHKAGTKYSETPIVCNECHKKGDKHKGMMGTDCERCHSEKTWKKVVFDHDKTAYKLLGRHGDVKCVKCHRDDKYKETPKLCNSCHKKDDTHRGRFGTRCDDCHVEKGWKETLFDHDRKSTYPLLFKHKQVNCAGCHKDDWIKGKLKTTCISCHRKDDKHKGIFGSKCEDCHAEKDWKETSFDHDRKSAYPLLFKHKQLKCAGCHKDDWIKGKLRTTCISCHQKDDKHKGIFGTRCEDCHAEKSWKETLFDHDRKSTYPLLFKHKQVKCAGCHKDDWTRGKLDTACVSCHRKDDKHKTIFGPKCETCHAEKDWKEIIFDHDRQTKSPLLGKHRQAKCADCHKSGRLNDKMPTLCFECHAKDDMHKNTFGPMCGTCHNEKNWKETFFDHYDETGYRLVGKHVGPKCVSCHKVRIYEDERFRKDCVYCHAKDDVHKGKEGKTCETCHTEMAWKQIIEKKSK